MTDIDGTNIDSVTRFEVITDEGRILVCYPSRIRFSLQDDDRTLKVFLEGTDWEAAADHHSALAKDLGDQTRVFAQM